MGKKKSWKEKLQENKGLPKIVTLEGRMKEKWGEGTMVVPSPMDVKEIMDSIPAGKLITVAEIRSALARKFGATIACPLTTGIFTWIVANAAEEERMEGKKDITPYWRTLKSGGVLNDKYPGGAGAHKKLLEEEGFRVVEKGKKYVVMNYKKYLAEI